MMKIIKKGIIPKTTKIFKCGYCGCVFECEENEYKYQCSQREEKSWYIAKCPTCGKITTLSE